MDTYTRLFNTKRFIGSQPITFNHLTFNNSIPYYITHKLDGERRLFIIESDTSSLVSSKMVFTDFQLPNRDELKDTVLDGELFNKKFYAFDILFYAGKDIRDLLLTERLLLLEKVNKILKSKKILLKKYISPYNDGICSNFFNMKNKYTKEMKDGTVDGIIFTPDLPYKEGTILKWKPVELLSIDFKIKKVDNNTVYLLTQKNELYKGYGKYKDIGIVKLSKEKYLEYNDGDVVEFIFKNNKFHPIRARPDKVMSNHNSVINSNFKTIINPPIMKEILC